MGLSDYSGTNRVTDPDSTFRMVNLRTDRNTTERNSVKNKKLVFDEEDEEEERQKVAKDSDVEWEREEYEEDSEPYRPELEPDFVK